MTAVVITAHPSLKAVAAQATPLPPDIQYRFAVIGDYGDGSPRAEQVASLVASWQPDFVISLGDNNYPYGEADTIDDHVGQYYSQFIGNYQGEYGSGSPANRFWPSLGNHDWLGIDCEGARCSGPYFDYFTLPGNERYYDVDYGLIHLFAVDGDFSEPDSNRQNGQQAGWLQAALKNSASCFKLVFFHNSPYSSGHHGSQAYMQWPFGDWGADVVLSGHDHDYERLDVTGMPYFVNGLGGGSITSFANMDLLPPGVTSLARYNRDAGAMLVTVTADQMLFQFYSVAELLIDEYALTKSCVIAPTPTSTVMATPVPTETATPTVAPSGTATGTAVAPLPATITNTPTLVVTATAVSTATLLIANPLPDQTSFNFRPILVMLTLLAGWILMRFIKS